MTAEELEQQQRIFTETLKKQQELFQIYTESALRSLSAMQKLYVQTVESGTKKYQETSEKNLTRFQSLSLRLMGSVVGGFENVLRDMTKIVGEGGFGRLGVEAGKAIGAALGKGLAQQFGKSPELGRQLGALLGGGFVAGIQAREGIRMLGARLMPVLTAGHELRTDFTRSGAQALRISTDIQRATGASQEEIFGLAAELSRLGIRFDQAGEKATRYALAAEKVLNLESGLVEALDATIITQYGESWQDVAKILQGVSSATEYWHNVARRTHSSLAVALSSTNMLAQLYQDVAGAVKGTALEATAMNTMLLGMVNTMGQMGLRPGMMGGVVREFMQRMAPSTTGSMRQNITQGIWISDILSRSPRGQQILAAAQGLAEINRLDPALITIPLTQLMATNQALTSQYFMSILEGISAMRASFPGTVEQQSTATLLRLEAAFGLGGMAGYVVMTMADEFRKNLERGMKPQEAFMAIGQSAAYKEATRGTEYAGKDPEEIMRQAAQLTAGALSTKDKAMLAVQEKLASVAEGLAELTNGKFFDDLATKGSILFDQAIQLLAPREAAAATRPEAAPLPPTRLDVPAIREAPPAEAPVKPSIFPSRSTPVFSYSKSTSRGIEQTTTFVDESALFGVKEALAAVESKGRGGYHAIGPVITDPSSRYFGQRALGRYQVMPANIPEWSKEALGYAITPREFYDNPALQEQIVNYQLAKLMRQYKTVEDVASVWHSGKPLARALRSRDLATGLSTVDYVRRVIANLPGRIG